MKKPIILGISAFYHDSAAAIIRGTEIIAAAQEERFTRKKFDKSFPKHAIEYCLKEAKITPSQIDSVAFPYLRHTNPRICDPPSQCLTPFWAAASSSKLFGC